MILSARAENLKLGSTGSTSSTNTIPASASSTGGKLDPKYFYHTQQLNPANIMANAGFDLQKKQPQAGQMGANPLVKTNLASVPLAPAVNLAVPPMQKPAKTAPSLASNYFPS